VQPADRAALRDGLVRFAHGRTRVYSASDLNDYRKDDQPGVIQRLPQHTSRCRRLVDLLCLVVVLQSLWCCAWHVHVESHAHDEAGLVHHEHHAEWHVDTVDIEPAAVLNILDNDLAPVLLLCLVLFGVVSANRGRPRLFDVALPTSLFRLQPPGRSPPLH